MKIHFKFLKTRFASEKKNIDNCITMFPTLVAPVGEYIEVGEKSTVRDVLNECIRFGNETFCKEGVVVGLKVYSIIYDDDLSNLYQEWLGKKSFIDFDFVLGKDEGMNPEIKYYNRK